MKLIYDLFCTEHSYIWRSSPNIIMDYSGIDYRRRVNQAHVDARTLERKAACKKYDKSIKYDKYHIKFLLDTALLSGIVLVFYLIFRYELFSLIF